METKTISQTVPLAATPAQVFETYMTSPGQAAFTGKPATISPANGADFSTFGGMIRGRNLEIVPDEKIVRSWAIEGMDWPSGHESKLTLELFPDGAGTRLEMKHEFVPLHIAMAMMAGWNQWYWQPLAQFLEARDVA